MASGISFENSAWFNPIAAISNLVHNVSENGLAGAIVGSEKYPVPWRAFANSVTGNGNPDEPMTADVDPFAFDEQRIVEVMEAAEDKANEFNLSSARETNDFNSREAQLQRDWLERLSNTEVQRRINDLREAGLNPAIAYANPASTPSGSAASGVSASAAMQPRSARNVAVESAKISASVLETAIAAVTSIATKGVASVNSVRKIGFRP